MPNVPILTKRRQRKQAELNAAIDARFDKAMSPAIVQAAEMAAHSGAAYPVNPSSPFAQTGGYGGAFNPLPRGDNFDSLFGPGRPLTPDPLDRLDAQGRAGARRWQYRVTENINLLDRQADWSLLRRIASEVDVVSRCIELVQDACVGMEWSWSFSRQIINQIRLETGEKNSAKATAMARDKYGEELTRVQKFFERPDRRMGYTFSQVLTQMVWANLVYDGIAIVPSYTFGGDLHSLSLIDTSTVKILLDNQGFLPQPPAPAYQQILYGFPRGEFQAESMEPDGKVPNGYQADQMAYYVRRPRLHTVYGFSTVEECINYATLYQQRQEWMHAEWSNGVTPKLVIKTTGTEGWTPEQFGYFQQILNDEYMGQTRKRQGAMVLRPGMEPIQLHEMADTYKTDFDEWCVMQIGAKFGVPQSQLGIPMKSMRSMSGTQNQTSMDLTDKFALDALVNFLVDCFNDLAQRFLGIGSEITMTATSGNGDSSDFQRAQADASDVNSGIRTRNEIRVERGLPLISEVEADELGVTTATGVTFITGQLEAQEAQLAQLEAGGDPTNRQRSSRLDGMADPAAKPTGTKRTTQEGSRQPDVAQTGSTESGSYSQKALTDGQDNPDTGRWSGASGSGETEVSGTGPYRSRATGNSNSPSRPSIAAKSTPTGAAGSSGSTGSDGDAGQRDSATTKELAAFARFVKSRKNRTWRDFDFEHVDTQTAKQLNLHAAAGWTIDTKVITNELEEARA